MRYRTFLPLVAILLAGLTACQQGGQARGGLYLQRDGDGLGLLSRELGGGGEKKIFLAGKVAVRERELLLGRLQLLRLRVEDTGRGRAAR